MQEYKNLTAFIIFTALLLIGAPAFASNFKITADTWPHAIMGLLGGITFLLYGLDKMTSSFKSLAGERLKYILGTLTKNKISALMTGATVTAIVQSSAATTVMVVGFISAKLMTLPQSLGVILGADIGTTLTVQLIAFKLNQYALLFIILGFLIKSISKKESIQHLGRVIMAIGIVFFGIFLIGESMALLQTLPIVKQTLSHISSPILGILAGFIITALMQSSSASLAIVIALTDQSLLSIAGAFYLVLGCNVGTCITAAIASLKSSQDGQRAAAAHVFFKTSGALFFFVIFMLFTDWFTQHIILLDASGLSNSERAVPRQIAHIHTIFNITLALIYLPLTDKIASILTKLIKTKRKKWRVEASYLDTFLLSTPSLAINAARSETSHMAKRVQKLMRITTPAVISGNVDALSKLQKQERDIDALYSQIIDYLGRISTQNLSADESLQLIWLMSNVNRLENISDLLGEELFDIGTKRQQKGIKISKTSAKNLESISKRVENSLKYSSNAIASLEVKLGKDDTPIDNADFKKSLIKATNYQTKRLVVDTPDRIETYGIEMDIIDKLQRTFYHTRKMAKDTNILLQQRSDLTTNENKHQSNPFIESV